MEIITENNIQMAYNRLEEIDTELKYEYDMYGETVYASQLECEYERIEDAICEYEATLS